MKKRKSLLSPPSRNPSATWKVKGFTLLETVIVMVVLLFLLGFGLLYSVSFSRRQTVEQAAFEIKSAIEDAKHAASSRVKPTTGCDVLRSYTIGFTTGATDKYTIAARCSTPVTMLEKTLPPKLDLFPACSPIEFKVISQGVSCGTAGFPVDIVVQGQSDARKLSVDNAGNVTIAIATIAPTPTPAPTATPTPAATATNIWPGSTPGNFEYNDTWGCCGGSVELGVKFRSSVAGYIKGVRFYRPPDPLSQSRTFSVALWTRTGTQLRTASTSLLITSNSWQQILFASSYAISANTTYVASYHVPSIGGTYSQYAYYEDYFATAGYTNANLTALQNGVDGGNGVYKYSSSTTFPNETYNSANYWVDIVFSTTP